MRHLLHLPSSPILRKEFRLQRPTLLLGAAWGVVAVALFAMTFLPSRLVFGTFTLADLLIAASGIMATFLVPLTPVFSGICATIPERRSGTLDWQAALPVSRGAQWAAKVGVACAVVLAIEAAIALGTYAIWAAATPDHRTPNLFRGETALFARLGGVAVPALFVLAGTLAACWIASLFRETLAALGGAVAVSVATFLAFRLLDPSFLALPWFRPNAAMGGSLASGARESASLAILLGGTCLALFAMGASNWRFAPIGRLRAPAQGALWLAVFAASVLGSIRVRHGFDPLVGLEPVASKGLTPLLGTRPDFQWRPRLRLPGAVALERPLDGPAWRAPGTDRLFATFAVEFHLRRWSTSFLLSGMTARGGQLVEVDMRTGANEMVPGRIGKVEFVEPGGAGVSLETTGIESYRFGRFRFPLSENTPQGRAWTENRRAIAAPRASDPRETRPWSPIVPDVPTGGIVDASGERLAPGSPGHIQLRPAPGSRFVAILAGQSWYLTRPDSDPEGRLDVSGTLVALDARRSDMTGFGCPWLVTSDDAWFVAQPLSLYRLDVPREPIVLRSADGARSIPLDGPDGSGPSILSILDPPVQERPRLRVGSEPNVLPVSPDGRWLALAYGRQSDGNWKLPPLLDHEAFRERVERSRLDDPFGSARWVAGVKWEMRAIDLRSGESVSLGPLQPWIAWPDRAGEGGPANPAYSAWLLDTPDMRGRGYLGGLRVPVAWSPGGTLAVLHRDRLHLYRAPAEARDGASSSEESSSEESSDAALSGAQSFDAPPAPLATIGLEETRSDDLFFLDDETLILLGRYSIWRMDLKPALAEAATATRPET